MKNLFLVLVMFSCLNAMATMDASEIEKTPPTQAEISRNRACFQELRDQGCGDPGDDAQQFKSCMRNAYESLSSDCKSMMSKLYGKK